MNNTIVCRSHEETINIIKSEIKGMSGIIR